MVVFNLILSLVLIMSNLNFLSPNKEERLKQIKEAAESIYGSDTPQAKVAMAQAVLESRLRSAPSLLASKYNNLFGIKGKGTKGSVKLKTKEYTEEGKCYYSYEEFAVNATLDDSFKQHRKLMSKSRYKKVMEADTFEEAAHEIHKAGYATDPKYPQLIINVYHDVYS